MEKFFERLSLSFLLLLARFAWRLAVFPVKLAARFVALSLGLAGRLAAIALGLVLVLAGGLLIIRRRLL